MDLSKNQVMAMKQTPLDENLNLTLLSGTTTYSNSNYNAATDSNNLSCWTYWSDYYYPKVIRESYPVYIEHRALDKGKQAFEIIKMLKDKRFLTLEKVGDFIDIMDELIKIL